MAVDENDAIMQAKINKFSQDKIQSILEKPDEYIYDEFCEVKNNLQLDCELVIIKYN